MGRSMLRPYTDWAPDRFEVELNAEILRFAQDDIAIKMLRIIHHKGVVSTPGGASPGPTKNQSGRTQMAAAIPFRR
jgi:hypothetical protein